MKRLAIVATTLAGLLALAAFLFLQSEPQPAISIVAETSAPPLLPPAPVATVPTSPLLPTAPQPPPAIAEIRELDARLERLLPLTTDRKTRGEMTRLVVLWMEADAESALAWLRLHRGDPRIDETTSAVAQGMIRRGEFTRSQELASVIVEASTRDWTMEEAWSVAYERGAVTLRDLQSAGLTETALNSITSGARRD